MTRRDPSGPRLIAAMAADKGLRASADDFVLRRYPYNFTWFGVPVIQFHLRCVKEVE